MALALIVTLQPPMPAAMADAIAAYEKAKSGKALVRESDRLGTAARHKDVEPLTSMLSEDPAVLMEQLRADGFDPAKMRVPPERWYPAADGLKTIDALAAHVMANLNDFKQPNPILKDLKAAATLLRAAADAGVAFHFSNAAR